MIPDLADALSEGLHVFVASPHLRDTGRATVSLHCRIRDSDDLFDDFRNDRRSERLVGRAITVPHVLTDQPDRELLEWRGANAFRG